MMRLKMNLSTLKTKRIRCDIIEVYKIINKHYNRLMIDFLTFSKKFKISSIKKECLKFLTVYAMK